VATKLSFIAQLKERIGALDGIEVLEVGSGSGLASILLAQCGCKAHALDHWPASGEYISLLEREYKVKVQFTRGDAQYLPFEDESFDIVFNFGVLEHYSPEVQLRILSEMTRTTKKWIFVAIPNYHPSSAFSLFRDNSPQYDKDTRHKAINLKALCQTCNLQIAHEDGLSIYVTREELGDNNPEIGEFYRGISALLPKSQYEHSDIEWLVKSELALSAEDRLRFGFLNYVLARKRRTTSAGRYP
jgi:SAM-dependent methyltransferase